MTGPGTVRAAGRRALAGAAWMATLVGIVVLLHALGRGTLAAPPLLDRDGLRRWLAERDAVVAAFALVRLIGLALAGYLLAVTVLGLVARLSRVPALVAAVDVATVPSVRRALGSLVGVSLTASATSLVASETLPRAPEVPEATAGTGAPVVLERLPDGSDVVLRRIPAPVPDSRATMQVDTDAAPAPTDPSDDTATMRVDGGVSDPPAPGTDGWTIEPGDHLWSIAEAVLARAWGRAPTDEEVAPYWAAVVTANRARLPDPANPDLIRPGQVLTLPAVPIPPVAGEDAPTG